jgi:FAD/FMN-containing dehydrogenase
VSGPVVNFGRNIRFAPRHVYTPATEDEVLAILDRHSRGRVRVAGARHSWNGGLVSDDALVYLRQFNRVEVRTAANGTRLVTAGGGCRIKHLLAKLHRLGDVTLPTIGLVTEQTVAGAIATATHGSGRHSLSHYVAELRVAAYDAATGKPRVYTWTDGPELRAGRCSVGCTGIVLAVTFRGVPRYDVAEVMVPCPTLEEVLAAEDEYPLQQFYLIPYRWTYFAQRRRVEPKLGPRRWAARLFRAWWFLGIDVGLHVAIKTLTGVLKSPGLTRFFFRHLLPKLILKNVPVVDRSEKMLVMEHELFRHLEIEIYVPARHLRRAVEFVRGVLEVFAGTATDLPLEFDVANLRDELAKHHGAFTHHYPVTFRRVLPDDTLISPTADAGEPYYAISFITYVEPRDQFLSLATFLTQSMTRLFEARLHWGKYFPLGRADVEAAFPRLAEFRAVCERVDPNGVFRNEFTQRIISGHRGQERVSSV